jgi:hypothetical protein
LDIVEAVGGRVVGGFLREEGDNFILYMTHAPSLIPGKA